MRRPSRLGLAFQQLRRVRGQALRGQVDAAAEERQDLADDLGGEAGVEQPPDLLDRLASAAL